MKIHTGENPFEGSQCDKDLKSNEHTHYRRPIVYLLEKGNLPCHMIVHTGEKLFVCGHCGRAFSHI